MNNRKITIGRAPGSDIRIEERWDTVSNEHAEIESIDNGLLFYDHSSNGTSINGQKIHNTNVPIYPGDEILLAGVYRLDWEILERYFPTSRRPTVTKNIHGEMGRSTVRKDVYTETDKGSRQSGRKTEAFDYNRRSDGNNSGYQNQCRQKHCFCVFAFIHKLSIPINFSYSLYSLHLTINIL